MTRDQSPYSFDPLDSLVAAGIMGLAVGDAMGVPEEFRPRQELDLDPVTDFRAYGTFSQPAGTWSDDTSLTLCLLDSLSGGLDYGDIMEKFQDWKDRGAYTPYGEAFDMGRTTVNALYKFKMGTPPARCGGDQPTDNGNGSLMRILPAAFYLYDRFGTDTLVYDASEVIHNISSLTHRHPRSIVACGIYTRVAILLISGKSAEEAAAGAADVIAYYSAQKRFAHEASRYSRLASIPFFRSLSREEIRSSGYVVDTLEAAIWCLLTTDSYRDCILKAVNLGEDTDTTAAVAGGLAGILYGYCAVREMAQKLAKADYILALCKKFERAAQGTTAYGAARSGESRARLRSCRTEGDMGSVGGAKGVLDGFWSFLSKGK